MSYSIYDSRGYVGDLATVEGLKELRTFLASQGQEASQLKILLNNGHVRTSVKLLEEFGNLPEPGSADVKKTLFNLEDLVAQCEDIVIITDGVFDEGEGTEATG